MEEAQGVGLDRAGLGVDAGDRARVDRVAEVGAGRLAPGDDRVGERLEGGVRVDRGRHAEQRVRSRDRQRPSHEHADADGRRPPDELPARQLRDHAAAVLPASHAAAY